MNAPLPCWDIFCAVIDNYGDIGVAWRLARVLAGEYALSVRLWVDDLAAFQKLCPEVSPEASIQTVLTIEIRNWARNTPFPETIVPGHVVIEAFGCPLPETYLTAMAGLSPSPVWINLEYLSAEPWVETCHAQPSPHPRLPLVKHFFFPGFTPKTGGLLRERALDTRHRAFSDSPAQKASFWKTLGLSAPAPGTLTVFLLTYENAALPDLLDFWASGTQPVRCLVPPPPTRALLERFPEVSAGPEKRLRQGRLEIAVLPSFLPQTEFDALLWCSDINFVRGEDSFVRAQWAEKPFVWHLYPQEEKSHLVKMNAFLDLFCDALPQKTARALRAFHHAWNENQFSPEICSDWMASWPLLRRHAEQWAERLKKQEDLGRALVHFCLSRL